MARYGLILRAAAVAVGASSGATCAYADSPAVAQADATPAQTGAQAAPARAPQTFDINAFDVSGVTRLTAAEVDKAIYPFEGPNRTEEDVSKAVKALQDAYNAKGYEAAIVDIPEQATALFSQGIIALRVNEVPVGKVVVSGAKHHSEKGVLAAIPAAKPGEPLDLKALQTQVADANRYPDRQIQPTFKPGGAPGTLDVDLQVDSKLPVHFSEELNNDHSPQTHPLRSITSIRYADLWHLGHTIAGTYIVAPADRKQSEVFAGSYVAPIAGTPWTFLVSGYTSNSNVAALGGSTVLGNGWQVGARVIYRLPGDKLFQTLSFGVDYKNFNQNILIGSTSTGSTPIRYAPVVAEYALSRAGSKSTLDVNVNLTAGLRVVKNVQCIVVTAGQPCQPVDQFQQRELNALENFVHSSVTVNYTRVLRGDLSAAVKLTGQVADSHLVTNEQYTIGGLSSVRGYLQTEAVGDEGFAGGLELRLPSLAPFLPKSVDEFRFYSFVDGGFAHIIDVSGGQQQNFHLLGVGGGARLRLFKALSGDVAVGVPLIDGPVSPKGQPRVTFTAKGEF